MAPEVRGGQFGYVKAPIRVLILAIAVLLIALSPGSAAGLIRIDESTRPDLVLEDLVLQDLGLQDLVLQDLVLQDLDGRAVSLREFAGRTVIVHFFATWCEPCREELPALNRLHERSPDATVLAISVAENGQRVSRFFRQKPVRFPVLLDSDRAAARSRGITTLPTTYVLDAGLRPRWLVEADYPWDTVDVARDGELAIRAVDRIEPTSE